MDLTIKLLIIAILAFSSAVQVVLSKGNTNPARTRSDDSSDAISDNDDDNSIKSSEEHEGDVVDDDDEVISSDVSDTSGDAKPSNEFVDFTLKAVAEYSGDYSKEDDEVINDDDDYDDDTLDDSDDDGHMTRERDRKKTELNYLGKIRQKFGLTSAIYADHKDLVCSPISALLPLGKLALGATGLALNELSKAIGLSTEQQIMDHFKSLLAKLKNLSGVKLHIASQIFVSNRFRIREVYIAKLARVFDTPVEMVDFHVSGEAAKAINNWVATNTHGRIPHLMKAGPGDISAASLVIANTVFFLGEWEHRFHKSEKKHFYTNMGRGNVKMMTRKGRYRYTKSHKLRVQAVQIPYKGNKASMIVILPRKKQGLKLLLKRLNESPNLLKELIEQLKDASVEITLPKFKIETRLKIPDIYKKIGVSNIFKNSSGLNGIAHVDNLHVSDALQLTIIEVDELGTEAASATAIQLTPVKQQIFVDLQEFKADHPFYFLILEEGEQLFAGIYSGSGVPTPMYTD